MSKQSDWHHHVVINGVRLLALPRLEQLRLCAPFVALEDELCRMLGDGLDHALHFEATTGELVFNDSQRKELEKLAESAQAWFSGGIGNKGTSHGSAGQTFWDEIRARSLNLLKAHGWEGPIDTKLFRYSDPATGRVIEPSQRGSKE